MQKNIVKPHEVRTNWNCLCIGCLDREVAGVLVHDQGILYQVGSSFLVQDPFGIALQSFKQSPLSYGYEIKVLNVENLVIRNECGTPYVDISDLSYITTNRTAVFVKPSVREPLKNELVYKQLFEMISMQYSWYTRQMYLPFTVFITNDMDANVLRVIAENSLFFTKFGMAYVALFSTFKSLRERIGTQNNALIHCADTVAYFNKTEESETSMLLDFAVPYAIRNGHRIVHRQSGVPLELLIKQSNWSK